tara:strand:- start:51 stop:1733 length:1683 start_codon:yes stop_codon:yes gene_type:complete
MLSVSGRDWQETKIDERKIEKYSQKYNLSNFISKLLINNKFDEDEIYYLNQKPEIDNTYKNLEDFKSAAKLIDEHIEQDKKILLFGDYDVDGGCSVALLAKYLKFKQANFDFFIPDRVKDGYGPNLTLMKQFFKEKINLIIFVDCGTNSFDEINFLNSNGIKSIIIDHHKIDNFKINPSVFINPLKSSDYKKYNFFCSTNLVFFLLRFILSKNKENIKFNLSKYLIYAALGTICDVMPLRGINRYLSIEAINSFNLNEENSFFHILKLKKINRKLTIDDLAYLIGPVLNSGGRLGKSKLATKLLISEDKKEVEKISTELLYTNEKRKIIEDKTLQKIEKKIDLNKNYIFHVEDSISEGILGIIAARLAEKYNRPVVLATYSGNIIKGSARSIEEIDIGKILLNLKQNNILIKGGGHAMAGGFSSLKKNIKKIDEYLQKQIKINRNNNFNNYLSQHSLSLINNSFLKDLRKISPFGSKNPSPILLFNKIKIIKTKIINKKHIFFVAKSGTKSCDGMAFNSLNNQIGNILLYNKREISIISELKESTYKNKSKLQLILKDII